jgi:hypothetical protein
MFIVRVTVKFLDSIAQDDQRVASWKRLGRERSWCNLK